MDALSIPGKNKSEFVMSTYIECAIPPMHQSDKMTGGIYPKGGRVELRCDIRYNSDDANEIGVVRYVSTSEASGTDRPQDLKLQVLFHDLLPVICHLRPPLRRNCP